MKFGLREICDVVFKAKSSTKIGNTTFKKGMPVLYFDSATTSSLASETTTVYAQGGRGNPRLIAWEGEKQMTFQFENAVLSPMGLAILTGAGLTEKGEGEVFNVHRTQVVEATGAACTLNKIDPETGIGFTVSTGADFKAYAMLLDSAGEVSAAPIEVTIAPSTFVVTTAGETPASLDEGTYLIDYYIEAATDVSQIDITPDCFGGYFYIEASTLFRRVSDGKDLPAEFSIPKAKIQSGFTFDMSSSGDPSTFPFVCDAFPDYLVGNTTKKVLAAIQVIGDSNEDFAGEDDVIGGDTEEYPYN